MRSRAGRVDRWVMRHPLGALAGGFALLGWMVSFEIERIAAARLTVAHGWAAGLAAGTGAGLALAALTVALLGTRKRRAGTSLGAALTVVISVSAIFAFLTTAPPTGSGSRLPYIVTTGVAVAGMAYAATIVAVCLALICWSAVRLIRIRLAGDQAGRRAAVPELPPRDVLTSLIGPRGVGWDVTWVGDGRLPRRLAGATLTEVADEAATAVVTLYLRRPPSAAAGTDFQIAIFPYRYTTGPVFGITGGACMFTAADKESGRILRGATLEDLVAAAESAGDLLPGEYMFHWVRPVTALSPLTPSAGPQPGAATGPAQPGPQQEP